MTDDQLEQAADATRYILDTTSFSIGTALAQLSIVFEQSHLIENFFAFVY